MGDYISWHTAGIILVLILVFAVLPFIGYQKARFGVVAIVIALLWWMSNSVPLEIWQEWLAWVRVNWWWPLVACVLAILAVAISKNK